MRRYKISRAENEAEQLRFRHFQTTAMEPDTDPFVLLASALHQAVMFGSLSMLAPNWNTLSDKVCDITKSKLPMHPLWPNEEDALSALTEDIPAAWASLRENKQIGDLEGW
jgi:hypothetical protein